MYKSSSKMYTIENKRKAEQKSEKTYGGSLPCLKSVLESDCAELSSGLIFF